jgi:hypothetical protein
MGFQLRAIGEEHDIADPEFRRVRRPHPQDVSVFDFRQHAAASGLEPEVEAPRNQASGQILKSSGGSS